VARADSNASRQPDIGTTAVVSPGAERNVVKSTDEITLRALLGIENDPAIAEFQCASTGIPVWPQIRIRFFRMLMSDLLYESELTGVSGATTSRRQALTFMGRALWRNLLWRWSPRPQAQIGILTDAIADQLRDGKWFNRLSDHFALCRPQDTLTIEDHWEWRWPFPRHNQQRLLFHSPTQAGNVLVGRVRMTAKHRRMAQDLVALICERAEQRYGWIPGPARKGELVSAVASKTASMPWQYNQYERLLKRMAPRVLLASSACYGSAAATLMVAANRAGIATAEFQHGAVSGGHDAYNFAPAILGNDAYRATFPRYFLAYGQWWGGQMNVPVTKVVIGNPHREDMLTRVVPRNAPKRTILILSDGAEFDKYLHLAQTIEAFAARRDLRIVVRPHPLERTMVHSTHGGSVGSIEIDSNADLYVSLGSAHAVVSEVSTGLFEAAGLADKLFMWDTPKTRFGYPEHPFQAFATPEILLSLLSEADTGQLKTGSHEAIWATQWRDNYQCFIDGCLAAGQCHGSR
jgi:hypothetical protein